MNWPNYGYNKREVFPIRDNDMEQPKWRKHEALYTRSCPFRRLLEQWRWLCSLKRKHGWAHGFESLAFFIWFLSTCGHVVIGFSIRMWCIWRFVHPSNIVHMRKAISCVLHSIRINRFACFLMRMYVWKQTKIFHAIRTLTNTSTITSSE